MLIGAIGDHFFVINQLGNLSYSFSCPALFPWASVCRCTSFTTINKCIFHHTTQIIWRLDAWLCKERMDFFLFEYNINIICYICIDIYLDIYWNIWI